ncbi:uncharacterized protein [Oscarella lobularis]|uniref:uncharacterized protein isoform X2 n=1 Tax=Oscarella lobularis TaxID=121494 RepID=UPI003313A3A4
MLLSTEHTNNLPDSKGNDRRGLVALLFGLAILFGVASTPVVVYYFMPPNQLDTGFNATRVQVVSTEVLEKSVCTSAFRHWNWFAIKTSSVNISIADCGNFSKAEQDLEALFQSASTKNLPPSFIRQYTLNVCRYVYKKHDRRNEFLSREPMCERNESFVSEGVSLSCLSLSNCTRVNCSKPLLYTENKFAREHGFYCSLPCEERAWRNPVIINLFYGSYYVSVAIFWPCIAVVVFTWFKVKEMFSYQSVTGLLFALSYAVVAIATMFPVFWGRNKVYCKYDDLIDSWKDPTKLCQIQGLMGQFGLVSSLMWWASSVCNTLLSLFRHSNYSHRQRKIVFFVQLTLALIVPGGLTTFSIVHGVQYTRNTYQTTLCTPSSYSSLFYVSVLPSTIIIFIGTFASAFVIYKLYQAKKLIYLRDCVANNSEISLSQKRFFVLSIFIPLSYSVTMTSAMTTNESFLRNIQNDMECLKGSPKCKDNDTTTGMLIVLGFALWNAIVIAAMVYCLTQHKGARAYWLQIWKKATNRKWMQKKADEMEGPTETTRLFTDRTLSSS